MLRLRRRRAAGSTGHRGQSLVEFALVFPVFVLLLSGMIDFGMGLYSYMTIINAARDGARLGATACSAGPCSSAVSARVTAAAGGLAPSVTVACTNAAGTGVNCATGPTDSHGSVTVTAAYTYRMLWPLMAGTQLPMSSSIVFMVE